MRFKSGTTYARPQNAYTHHYFELPESKYNLRLKKTISIPHARKIHVGSPFTSKEAQTWSAKTRIPFSHTDTLMQTKYFRHLPS